jgi:DNA-binding transcriptional ArsR family regulator
MDEVEKLAEIFKALSDPTRLKLVKLLTECSPDKCECSPDDCECSPDENEGSSDEHERMLCVNALTRRLGVTQSAVSQHLRVLRQAGLVQGQRRGSFVHYSLSQTGLEQYKALLLETLGEDFGPG